MKKRDNNNQGKSRKQQEDAAIFASIAIMSLFVLAVTLLILFNLK